MKIAVAFALLASLVFPVTGMAAENLGVIQGSVRDLSNIPVSGALVIATAASSALGERMAFTDNYGTFVISNLLAGDYSVKVTMSRFLPVMKSGIHLSTGQTEMLQLNMQTAMNVFLHNSRDEKDAQEMIWVLRSARGAQPVLRLLNPNSLDDISRPDYSGYLQLYSRSTETSGGSTTDTRGSRFSVTMPLQNHARVTVDGQYNESPDQPRGFGARYEFSPRENHQSTVSMNLREGPLLNGSFPGEDLKEIQLKYNEKVQLVNHLILNYTAETGRTAGNSHEHYFRPAMALSFVPNSQTTIGVSATAEAPTQADDPIRGKEYFEQQSFLPPAKQSYRHAEVTASRYVSGATKITGGVFKEQSDTHTLFVVLPDRTSSFLVVDGRNNPSQGARIFIDHDFKNFDAGIGYTVASGIGLKTPALTMDEVRDQLAQRQFHVVTARISTDVDLTNTHLTAVYRWVSSLSAAPVDPYQSNVEYSDPTLSITVAQTLPTWGAFPAKVQAILDARNVLEQIYGNRSAQISNSPRFVKGGINIRF
jgi:hypothetical protein